MGHITFCVLWITSVFFISTSAQNKLNDQCQVARSGSMGRCQYLENCSVVLKEINEQGLFPNFCTSQDRKQLVCCPLPPTKRTTVKPSTPSRISAQSKFSIETQKSVGSFNLIYRRQNVSNTKNHFTNVYQIQLVLAKTILNRIYFVARCLRWHWWLVDRVRIRRNSRTWL